MIELPEMKPLKAKEKYKVPEYGKLSGGYKLKNLKRPPSWFSNVGGKVRNMLNFKPEPLQMKYNPSVYEPLLHKKVKRESGG